MKHVGSSAEITNIVNKWVTIEVASLKVKFEKGMQMAKVNDNNERTDDKTKVDACIGFPKFSLH